MRLARFRTTSGEAGFGIVSGDEVVRLDHRVDTFGSVLARLPADRPDDPRLPVGDLRWDPPIGDHAKIVCVGFNYAAHASESERPATDGPDHPTLFTRFADSFVGAGTPVVRPASDDTLDWEDEAALVIGAPGRRIPAEDAWRHVAGVTCIAENSVRSWQLHSNQATAGKNWHHSGAVGPWVTTVDEVGIGPPRVTTRLNGTTVQDDTTDRLTFGFAELVAYVSTLTPLRPGDLIATGTPKGIGFRMDPPRFLRPGDELEVEVSGVGTLRHGVVDEARTTVEATR
ncbi:Fumarylacetoacetate hydrolase family protein [Pseudonocardia sp. Ae168_Ps1]|uniref:fumarylacetoacetate hydrolase family protein n=1 Tax=unclassified Pseudonocardia TaxID=2619320 RepID=UPI00094AD99C|nr:MULTISPECIES: fumarylacetoacetate hydrolase family protein [unclassified Pseudonocardia]OLL76869.1 Fumarylacetoacetate hydrolase family protein [Pseudonocardia sp. Ae150A_Ps1]OLL82883.1 Fumarylacetoacetate hydrolase family protein [Pseudonocardia sp. Ae168_Ps1]OLL83005.1 Fumarylacetoacetate hydrolase family protein [Pseudonocardia sp. Ae263_Ps1]OLL90957.1 Fumarylacetoacetate hydrolase family protein [Pseudonocardia sp. Ae356_Ps1]